MPGGSGAGGTSLTQDTDASAAPPGTISLIPSIAAGAVVCLGSVVNTLGTAALAFPGPLSVHIGTVIGILLAGAAVAAVFGALFADLPGTLMESQEAPAMLMGLMGASLFVTLPDGVAPEQRVALVVLAFATVTVATGAFFLLLGWFRLGEMIRYIPFPVIGGVLAGLGLLMVLGGLSVVTGAHVSIEHLDVLLTVDALARWLPATAFAIVIMRVTARSSHYLTVPTLLLAATVVFYGAMTALGRTPGELEAAGWLLGPFPEGNLFEPVHFGTMTELFALPLGVVLPTMGSAALVATIGVLLHASGLELAARQDIDLNQELRVCGAGNIGAGLLGGVPVFHSLSNTLLSHRMGAGNRLTPLVVVAGWIVVLIFGGAALGLFPRPVLAGLLIFLGLSLLWEWLVQGYRTLPRGDWIVVLLIVLTVAVVGYMEGIALGVLAGVILFQVGYSRIDVVKHDLSGAAFHSCVERTDEAHAALRAKGHRIHVLQLQGYVFFGTANNIVRRVRQRIAEQGAAQLRWMVLDFRLVDRLDWAAINSFRKLLQTAESSGFRLVLSGGNEAVRGMLEKGEITDPGGATVWTFDSLDEAMQGCENTLLEELGIRSARETEAGRLPELVRRALPERAMRERLRGYLEYQQVPAGEVLIRQGEPSDSLYFVQNGQASVYVETATGARLRVKVYMAGSIVGEIGLYTGGARTATVAADSPIEVWRLCDDALERMRRDDADLAGRFHEMIVRLLGERLSETNRLVGALMA